MTRLPSLQRLRELGYPINGDGAMRLPPPARMPPEPAPLDEQFAQLEALTPQQRVAAMYRGALTLSQLCRWAAGDPDQVAVIDGEFVFITAHLCDHEPATTPQRARHAR